MSEMGTALRAFLHGVFLWAVNEYLLLIGLGTVSMFSLALLLWGCCVFWMRKPFKCKLSARNALQRNNLQSLSGDGTQWQNTC